MRASTWASPFVPEICVQVKGVSGCKPDANPNPRTLRKRSLKWGFGTGQPLSFGVRRPCVSVVGSIGSTAVPQPNFRTTTVGSGPMGPLEQMFDACGARTHTMTRAAYVPTVPFELGGPRLFSWERECYAQ